MERNLNKMKNNNTNSTRSNLAKDNDLFHVIHKVPCGDTPYVKAKHAQVHILLLLSFFCVNHFNNLSCINLKKNLSCMIVYVNFIYCLMGFNGN